MEIQSLKPAKNGVTIRMRLLICILLLFSMIPLVEAELDDGWIMDRHDSQRSGLSSSDAPDTAYLLWKFEIPYTNLVNSPLGTADRIVVRTSRNLLLCIDMNGKEVWKSNKRIDSAIVIENSVIISEGTYLILEEHVRDYGTTLRITSADPLDWEEHHGYLGSPEAASIAVDPGFKE